LPVEFRIEYKILLLTFKSMNGLAPAYLSDLLMPYVPARSLRSSNMNLLKEHDSRTVTYGQRAFACCAPKLWNSLPNDLRSCSSLDVFKKCLKTHLFRKAFKLNE
jgi:hypothetical protein